MGNGLTYAFYGAAGLAVLGILGPVFAGTASVGGTLSTLANGAGAGFSKLGATLG